MINKFTVKPRQITDWMGNIRKTWYWSYSKHLLQELIMRFRLQEIKTDQKKKIDLQVLQIEI